MIYNDEEEESFLTDEQIQEQGLDKVIENIYLRNGANEEYAQVTAPLKDKIEMKRKEKKERKQKIKEEKEKEKQRQQKLKEIEKEMQSKQEEYSDMGKKKKKEKVDASTQIIIALYVSCILMVGAIFAMVKLLK